ncbi:Zn-dependent hydrolase [Faecalicatena contorta]|uniref:Zn-dependent hydrolase n=1 Tax=Faecalicatena contorta TaxID=39482 RepID=UPI001F26DDF1|nr:Zn-dependent hydrolase [Faecalicatena contorta]MCF2554965.1 Zn-dependent hydrolase [Faecalicatena contorta]
MKTNPKRVISRIEEIYECGKQEDGTHTRMAFSNEDVKGRKLFTSWAEKLGMTCRMDEAGNLIARMDGQDNSLPAILMGSHLDTVPDGGKYDGVTGCIGGLEVCEVLKESGYKTNHPIEVIVFTDEEGFRFGKGLLGSSAICGQDPDISDDEQDIYGETRGKVMQSYGIKSKDVQKAARDPKSVHCFIELHVEQGARLYKTNTSVGVVSSIAGVNRYEITVTGEANHAGSTAMADRRDALVAAAGFINKVPEVTAEYGNDFTVATVGTIKVTPHSVNVIPGTCTFSLEIRDQDQKIMTLIEQKLQDILGDICKKYGVSYTFVPTSFHEPAPMSEWVKGSIEDAIKGMGIDYSIIPSGAFHDSLIMTSVFPTGMIFVPSEKGISHSRYEYTKAEDIEKGCNVLLQTILKVDKS